jgi:NAD(P)-dependent dehydrogenase (short-subunit alcohol dehydrogenase family)
MSEVVIITGASRGIGREIAKRLRRKRFHNRYCKSRCFKKRRC